MSHRLTFVTASIAVLVANAMPAAAADLVNGTPTALKEPECIADPASLFFSDNTVVANPPHPTLPIGHYYEIVRYLGPASVSTATSFDYGHFPQDYAWAPVRGQPITGLTVPSPGYPYQRTSRTGANSDNSSGFQLNCYDSGSFINTWTFPHVDIAGGGAHSIYGYSFDEASLPSIYDRSPGTDFVLQASIEIPWFYSVIDPTEPEGVVPVGQASMFAYFRDLTSGKVFGLVVAIFDNRYAAYSPFTAHDGATPFVSMPLGEGSQYATISPYSSTYTPFTWSGLRFFRAQVTQDNFRTALADINDFCADNTALRFCSSSTPGAPAFSTAVTDYVLTDFGVLHEVFPQSPGGNLSMGLHVYGLGAWNFR